MWGINYQTLIMMIADQSRYVSGEQAQKNEREQARKQTGKRKKGKRGSSGALGHFQSKLNK